MDGAGDAVEFGSRVVLQLEPGASRRSLLRGTSLRLARTVETNLFILQAPDAPTALREAARLAALPGVRAAYPVVRREAELNGPYASRPNDPHFPPQLGNVQGQWYLENRDTTNGASLGVDLNVRGAWAITRGEGVTLAIGDVGVELSHLELTNRALGGPHRNFLTGALNGNPLGISATHAHGTACAGLALAEAGNAHGMAGVAPRSQLAAWVVFTNRTGGIALASDEQLMDMFQYASNVVSVQSHSWSQTGVALQPRTPLEEVGIERAARLGRNGLGSVLVRAAGNDRPRGANAGDSGYSADPRSITVASVARNGRVTSYSEPGACVLVAAPSGEQGSSGLFSTDLDKERGTMFFGFLPPFEYLWNFVFNSLGFTGTSASAPQVAGVAALMLSANPQLGYRDVQQILALSSRHFDFFDPDLITNAAGLAVSHNLGFGTPDATHAVKLARLWTPRAAPTNVTLTVNGPLPIPDDGLRVIITGPGVPPALASIRCLPVAGPHADAPTPALPLVDVGLATNVIQTNLTGRAALIERGTNNFDEKITRAAQAGAAFVVLYNYATNTGAGCPGGEQLCLIGGTDFMPIPSVFIAHADGVALRNHFATNTEARAQLRLQSSHTSFNVADSLVCEHVGVRVRTDHPLRGDLRVTLVSPAGTRSILQAYNSDAAAGPVDWTWWSTHHFFEPTRGPWRVEVSDEGAGAVGAVLSLSLTLLGTPIRDADADGLDDDWERAHMLTTAYRAADDVDDDGYSNAAEQVMGTDPFAPNDPLRVDFMLWDQRLARLSWASSARHTYEIWAGPNPETLTLVTNIPGRFPETEWFFPYASEAHRFFRVRNPATEQAGRGKR